MSALMGRKLYAELGDGPASPCGSGGLAPPVSPRQRASLDARPVSSFGPSVQAQRRHSYDGSVAAPRSDCVIPHFAGAHPHLVRPPTYKFARPDDVCVRCRRHGPAHTEGNICHDGCSAIFAAPGVSADDVECREFERIVRKSATGRVGVCYVDTEVTRVFPDSGAEQGGMRPGMRICRIDGQPYHSGSELQRAFAEAGHIVSVTLAEISPAARPRPSPSTTAVGTSKVPGAASSSAPAATEPAEDDPFNDFMASRAKEP
eukprot:TRINITY_DN16375_c0_g1_i1.p1 TRINITY_DN16375_c0_g1~~TRINITY_DN16375_c0_g1_i1.p1  ORF type:complete len:260 (+),score=16.95 TRINITY_DN16375_c0_g1_i1:75-854(+)